MPAGKTGTSAYLKRHSHASDVERKARQEHVVQQLAEAAKKFDEIDGCLDALTGTDKEKSVVNKGIKNENAKEQCHDFKVIF